MMNCDPEKEFDIRDEQQAEWLASRPVCEICGDPIQDEIYYDLNNKRVCVDCVDSYLEECEVQIDNEED